MSKLLMAKHALLRSRHVHRLRAAWCYLSFVPSQCPALSAPAPPLKQLSVTPRVVSTRSVPPAASAQGRVLRAGLPPSSRGGPPSPFKKHLMRDVGWVSWSHGRGSHPSGGSRTLSGLPL